MRNPADTALLTYFTGLVGWLPWLVVLTIGGVVCLLRLSKHPREGWLVAIAIALALFGRFGVSSLIWLCNQYGLSINPRDGAWVWPLLYELPVLSVQAAAWGLLIYAAFGEGKTSKSRYLVEDDMDPRDG